MALVHDMAECIVGDITPSDNVSKEEKYRREQARDHRLKASVHVISFVVVTDVKTHFQTFVRSGSHETSDKSPAGRTQTGALRTVGGRILSVCRNTEYMCNI